MLRSTPAAIRQHPNTKRPTLADAAGLYLADLRECNAAGARRGELSTAAEFERLLRKVILLKNGAREIDSLSQDPRQGVALER